MKKIKAVSLSRQVMALEQRTQRLHAAGEHAFSGMILAYDAVSKGLYDEALLHLGAHSARLGNALTEESGNFGIDTMVPTR